MMTSDISRSGEPLAEAASHVRASRVRRVGVEEPTAWLEAGWRDLRRSPAVSLAYGLLFVIIGHLLAYGLNEAGIGSLVLPLAAGFLLVAPLAAVGLYEVSRCHEHGEPVGIVDALTAWRRNAEQIGLMGLALLVAMFAWIQVALIIFALFFQGSPSSLPAFFAELTGSFDNLPFLILGTAAGAVLATVVFAISLVSLPMLLDRDVTAAEAIMVSVAAVRLNWMVLIGWAETLVVLAGLGIVTAFFGLAITLPLAGHASWHAYRALVRS